MKIQWLKRRFSCLFNTLKMKKIEPRITQLELKMAGGDGKLEKLEEILENLNIKAFKGLKVDVFDNRHDHSMSFVLEHIPHDNIRVSLNVSRF